MSEAARNEIIPLWPTWIGRLQLSGAAEQNRALLELASQGPSDGNLFEVDLPVSGTYYVRVPADQEHREDPHARPACISFYDPRTGANMVTVGTESDARSTYVVSPAAGTLLLWPSPVQHSVHPNLSREHRISISFDLQMHPGDGSTSMQQGS